MIQDLPGDFWLTLTMQGFGDWLTPLMSIFTWLGYPQAYMILVAVIYWSIDRKLGLRLAIFLPVLASVNSILKQALYSPRPYWVNPEIKAIRVSNGFGMPSGHAQASIAWLYAAAILRRHWFWAVAAAVAFLVGISRVYLGVHFSSQVLAGWLIGLLVLLIFIRLEDRILSWFLGLGFSGQLAWIGAITFIMLILGGIFVYLLKDWQMPMDWIRNAADDLAAGGGSILSSVGLESVAGNAGGFLGAALGALLSHRRGGFDSGGAVWKRLLRSVLGLAGTVALYLLLMRTEPDESRDLLYSLWRFSGFFMLSFSAIFLLPLIFRRVRLYM